MKIRFPELTKEQFNRSVPVIIVARIRERAERKGWSLDRATTETLALGLGLDPSEFGIESDKQTA